MGKIGMCACGNPGCKYCDPKVWVPSVLTRGIVPPCDSCTLLSERDERIEALERADDAIYVTDLEDMLSNAKNRIAWLENRLRETLKKKFEGG